jgi:thiol-disulfide isomerase/thioredoxin
MNRLRACLTLAAVCLFAVFAAADRAAAQEKFQLPTNPQAWINSAPLTTEMLAGKAAFLWYFEEGCPRCRERWPAMIEAAKKFEGKPIVFIAINSGNERNIVQQYVREVALPWPVIVDTDRSLEKKSDVNEISLQNIYQSKLLMPDGRLAGGSFNLEESATAALTTAKWRVDPAEIPSSLKAAWLQIEFGNFAAAAPTVKKNVNAVMPDVKAAAEKLLAAVKAEMDKEAEAAKQSLAAGNKWDAYKAYSFLSMRFKGYDLPSDAQPTLKELAADEKVKNQIAALKLWDSAQRQTAAAAANSMRRIVNQYPDTEAAALAQAALDKTAD